MTQKINTWAKTVILIFGLVLAKESYADSKIENWVHALALNYNINYATSCAPLICITMSI